MTLSFKGESIELVLARQPVQNFMPTLDPTLIFPISSTQYASSMYV